MSEKYYHKPEFNHGVPIFLFIQQIGSLNIEIFYQKIGQLCPVT